eukprot:GILK01011132.1.p1 GENE.GILK01011132.1~~GILK01011132.1.p1  ORF type:complete len:532 (-),score=66.85 GILK01011132.1:240-1835(-)
MGGVCRPFCEMVLSSLRACVRVCVVTILFGFVAAAPKPFEVVYQTQPLRVFSESISTQEAPVANFRAASFQIYFDQPLYVVNGTKKCSLQTEDSASCTPTEWQSIQLHDVAKSIALECGHGSYVSHVTIDTTQPNDTTSTLLLYIHQQATNYVMKAVRLLKDWIITTEKDQSNVLHLFHISEYTASPIDYSNCTFHFTPTSQDSVSTMLSNFKGHTVDGSISLSDAEFTVSDPFDVILPIPMPSRVTNEINNSSNLNTSSTVGLTGESAECRHSDNTDKHDGATILSEIESSSELESYVESRTQMLGAILKPVFNAASGAIFGQFISMIQENVGDQLTSGMMRSVSATVPADVSSMVTEALTMNLTNLLTDSITDELCRNLSRTLTLLIAPGLSEMLEDRLAPDLHHALYAVLKKSVPDKVDTILPMMLERSLSISLTRSLTRSITHAMLPPLVLSLTYDPIKSRDCYECQKQRSDCYCNPSPMFLRDMTYYANHYADFYSDYYAEYYSNAVLAIDSQQHPKPPPAPSAPP